MCPSHRPQAARRRWRHSLYARSALFLLLGCGSLLGAMAALSNLMVDDAVDRLLGERLALARASGIFLEHRLRSDLEHIALRLRPLLQQPTTAQQQALTTALADEYRATLFDEGAFVITLEGTLLAAVPASAVDVGALVDLEAMRADGLVRGVVVSNLVEIGPRKVLVFLQRVDDADGRPIAFVGGLHQPAASNILAPLAQSSDAHDVTLELIDSRGVVVASTAERGLFRISDHDRLMASALARQEPLRGRCHSCHQEGSETPSVPMSTDVFAFAPLPGLDLGLAVHQPEEQALAPAFALQRQLLWLGLAFVALFLVFAGLSVRSVVHPVKTLTSAVRKAESNTATLHLGGLGQDEVGELAGALELWRERMFASRATAERTRAQLEHETETARRHLETLQDIAVQYTAGKSVRDSVQYGLDETLAALMLRTGAIEVRYGKRTWLAARDLSDDQVDCLLRRVSPQLDSHAQTHLEDAQAYRVSFADLSAARNEICARPLQTFAAAKLHVSDEFVITAVLGDEECGLLVDERRVRSLLFHVAMCTINRLLRESDNERSQRQQQYLHRVLKTQEGERRRVARELHDTLAQDLAALRLEIERVSSHVEDRAIRAELLSLEERAEQMLETVRNVLLDLRLSVLESMGFLPALMWLLERVREEHALNASLEVVGDEFPLDYEIAVTVFRIIQEALGNVMQHARAETVLVTVVFGLGSLEVLIEDDGVGFAADDRFAKPIEERGLGLVGMEERTRLLGGTIAIRSEHGEGTTVHVAVPAPRRPLPATNGAPRPRHAKR